MDQFLKILHYADIGYSIEFTKKYNRDFVIMTKRHSYVHDGPISCAQCIEHEQLKDINYFNGAVDFMYNEIMKIETSEEKTKQ